MAKHFNITGLCVPDKHYMVDREASQRLLYGWILYADGDSSFNAHYIDLYRNACQKRGMFIQLGSYHPAVFAAAAADKSRQVYEMPDSKRPEFVINRTRDYRLAEFLEAQGIRVFNHSQVARLGNNKAEAYRYMQRKGIPVMLTLYTAQTPPPWYPAVIKSCDGHGGTEVYLIRDEAGWKEWKQNLPVFGGRNCGRQYVVQQAASDLGKDVRVYIVGNRIAAAVMRTSETDFRSNYCLGGSVELYELSGKERMLVQRTIAGLSIGMAGIDFIFHEGEMVFNEIEDMAGARGLYSLTDYDIVDEYIHYIWEELQYVRSSTDKTAHL